MTNNKTIAGTSLSGRDAPEFRGDLDITPDIRQRARRLAKHCDAYKGASRRRSITQLLTTAIPFLALCGAMLASYEHAYWLSIMLTVPTAGLLVRLFIIQHDCGHGSFFKSRAANDRLGRMISILTLTPYGFWRKAHAVHHATSGNLGQRGVGDIDTLTVREYRALPWRRRLSYRFYRNPLVLLVVGAPVHFMVLQRIPVGLSPSVKDGWRSVLAHDLALAVVFGVLVAVVGWQAVVMTYVPMFIVAAWIGGWLFFIQHQFENTRWEADEAWDFHAVALMGSSYYVLPRVLQWFTGNIGLHHIHHLCGKIPNYRLQECLDGSPELQAMSRLTFRESLKCVRLALWDEDRRRLVGFRHLRALPAAA